MKIMKCAYRAYGAYRAYRAYPLHALSLPDQFRSEKSVFRGCGDSNRSEIDSQGPRVPLGSFRNRWGQSGDIIGRLRLENHENIEICPSVTLHHGGLVPGGPGRSLDSELEKERLSTLASSQIMANQSQKKKRT